jgi:hypothetical protein
MDAPEVRLNKVLVNLDPPVYVFNVELSYGDGEWKESYGSADLTEAYLRGVKAACAMLGVSLDVPPIPSEANVHARVNGT